MQLIGSLCLTYKEPKQSCVNLAEGSRGYQIHCTTVVSNIPVGSNQNAPFQLKFSEFWAEWKAPIRLM